MDGVPLVYNGMEVGDSAESGGPALTERVPILWAAADRRPEWRPFFKRMIALRRAHAALRQGETVWLSSSEEARVLSYLRRGGGEEFLIVLNLSSLAFTGTVALDSAASFAEVTPEVTLPLLPGESAPKALVQPPASLPTLGLAPWGFRIFRRSLGPSR
jgi:glycosidase